MKPLSLLLRTTGLLGMTSLSACFPPQTPVVSNCPRVAVLATCAALGFAIGMIGVDQQDAPADAALAFASRADFGGVVFDGDTTAGVR